MITLASLYDYTLPELPGITPALLDIHLREVARDFCRVSKFWRTPLDTENSVAGQAIYDLYPDESYADLVKVTKLTVNGVLLYEDRYTAVSNTQNQPKYERGSPPFTVSADMLELTLIPDEVPDASQSAGVVMEGAIQPSPTATTLPDFFGGEFRNAICFGAMARCMAMGSKPWTDRALASEYARLYMSQVHLAALRGSNGNTLAALRTRQAGL